MREIYNYPNPFIYQGLGVRLQHQIFAFSLHICYLSLCHVVHFGSRNLFLSYLYLWLSVSAAPLLCCLYVRNTVLRFTSCFQRTWGCQDSPQIDEGWAWGGLRRGSAAACWAALTVHTVWGWCAMSQLDLLYMVCCVLRDLYRIRHRHRQRQQQQETALIRWVGHTIVHPLHLILFTCMFYLLLNFLLQQKIAVLGFPFS